jgi:hypothetical protein
MTRQLDLVLGTGMFGMAVLFDRVADPTAAIIILSLALASVAICLGDETLERLAGAVFPLPPPPAPRVRRSASKPHERPAPPHQHGPLAPARLVSAGESRRRHARPRA